MKIYVNGEERDIPENATPLQLINEMGLTGRRIAMEVNTEIVPRSRYEEHLLQEGDRVELVHAIGGG
jgi:sulfur carrier protein